MSETANTVPSWRQLANSMSDVHDENQQKVIELASALSEDRFVEVLELASKLKVQASSKVYKLERAIADAMQKLNIRNTFPNKVNS